jgi:hypothetical protein
MPPLYCDFTVEPISANLRSSKMRKLWVVATRREVKVVIASGPEKGRMLMWVLAQQIRGRGLRVLVGRKGVGEGVIQSRRERIASASVRSRLMQKLVFLTAMAERRVHPTAVGWVCARES